MRTPGLGASTVGGTEIFSLKADAFVALPLRENGRRFRTGDVRIFRKRSFFFALFPVTIIAP